MMRKDFMGILITLLILALPATNAWATHRSDAEQAIEAAKAAHALAEKTGVASPETAQLIKDAEAMMPTRQYTKAVETAQAAIKQDQFAVDKSKGSAKVDADSAKGAEEAIAAAQAARKKASSVGGDWRDTGKFIKEAEALAKSGDFAGAIALADKARRQGELGYEQAMNEKGASFPSYMTKTQ